ncbi:aminotransferase class V-fold PLP-dependent enzyme [Neorhizobium sp. JUb45]|uniref:aminotransferase class V-fold PLP-dependent enzyme n=1 Tax=Neorhizobium sp. JUb45 TaxID=2485113 RepID=UPI0010EFCA7A|nr:aminotransferase class V-fold PLP-dependent enzyme [Neorhizobium sp. JUb45]TCR00472.1 selenocysteine lyase/cysteine desulfurase [Neorhizobium sp. JUb45]
MLTNTRVQSLRAATPGCAERVHFNHAGASLPPKTVTDAVIRHLTLEASRGPMEAAAIVADHISTIRLNAANLIGAEPTDIAFGSSGSAVWGMVFAALPPLRQGDRILVGRHEWGGNVATMQRAVSRAGARIDVIPCRQDGSVDADALAAMIDDKVRLISLTWLPANGGLINDAEAIGKIAKAAGIPYMVDAGQALGQIPIDVAKVGCDVLKAAGRKHLRGPRGTALLYIRSGFLHHLNPPFVDVSSGPLINGLPQLRSDARLFETAETSVASLMGVGEAITLASEVGVTEIRDRIGMLSGRLRERLRLVPGVELHDLGSTYSGLVSFTVEGILASSVRNSLAEKGINIGANGVSYTPYDMTARGLQEIARASVSYLNTEDEVSHLVEAVEAIAQTAKR